MLETGDIPAVTLLNIQPSMVKYTLKVGFLANALAIIFFATLRYSRGGEKPEKLS
jgi:hypothetical protein